MDELAATTPSSPFVGFTVLVDIVFLLPFSAFSCMGSVSVRNISLYSKLNRLSNHLRFAATSCAAQASKQNKRKRLNLGYFRVVVASVRCITHTAQLLLTLPLLDSRRHGKDTCSSFRYRPPGAICGTRFSAASISQRPLQKTEATRPIPTISLF